MMRSTISGLAPTLIVYLSGCDLTMPQKLLHFTNVLACLQQQGGRRCPRPMWGIQAFLLYLAILSLGFAQRSGQLSEIPLQQPR